MFKIITASVILASATFAADGAAIYKKCVACHGADGKTTYAGKVPPLAGQVKATIVENLKGYKAGSINKYGMGALMSTQAKMDFPDDAAIEAVADFIATLN